MRALFIVSAILSLFVGFASAQQYSYVQGTVQLYANGTIAEMQDSTVLSTNTIFPSGFFKAPISNVPSHTFLISAFAGSSLQPFSVTITANIPGITDITTQIASAMPTPRLAYQLNNTYIPYVWPAMGADGCLANDGLGNLTWSTCGSGGGSTTNVIDVNADLHCDPTGAIDCTSAISAAVAANPSATLYFTVPQHSTSATYLVGGSANYTFPSTVTLRFDNGAMISAGHGASGTITHIARNGFGTGNYTTSLSGCTSQVTAVGSESFTNCPMNLAGASIAVTAGLTNVPNCPRNCSISIISWNSFNLYNPAATTTGATGTEGGGAVIVQYGGMMQQDTTNSVVTWGRVSNISTVNLTNTLDSAATLVFTNVSGSAQMLPIVPGSITTSHFSYYDPGSNTSPSNTPGLYFNVDDGGSTAVSFSSAVANMPVVSSFAPLTGNGIGLLYCSGTTNFNGIYPIISSANSSSAVLQDLRATVGSESSGSCYVPYTVTVTGNIEAAQNEQIFATGSAVEIIGRTDAFVGWYGAGHGNAIADTYGIQAAAYLNPGRHIRIPLITAGAAVQNNPIDYVINDTITMAGIGQHFDGETNTLAGSVGTGTRFDCSSTTTKDEPCIIMPTTSSGGSITNLAVYGDCTQNVTTLTIRPLDPRYAISNDGILIQGSEPRIDQIQAGCFSRDGVSHLSRIGAPIQYGNPTPDYWHASNVFLDSNAGYGLSASGIDANGGIVDGNNWAKGNNYGGFYSNVEIAGTYINTNGDGNSGRFSGNSPISLTSLTVSGSGLSAVCTAITSSSLSGANNYWIVVAGTTGGSIAGVNGTWRTSTISGSTAVFPCPDASGGPATGGTANLADYNAVYTQLFSMYTGDRTSTYDVVGLVGAVAINSPTVINPYSEANNGCPNFSGLVIGGLIPQYMRSGGNCKNGTTNTYPATSPATIAAVSSNLVLQSPGAATTLLAPQPPSGSGATNNLLFSDAYSGNSTSYTGTAGLQWWTTQGFYPEFSIQETPGGYFTIHDHQGSVNADILNVNPNFGNVVTLSSGNPSTGTISLVAGTTQILSNGLTFYYLHTVSGLPAPATAGNGTIDLVTDWNGVSGTCAGGGSTYGVAISTGSLWVCSGGSALPSGTGLVAVTSGTGGLATIPAVQAAGGFGVHTNAYLIPNTSTFLYSPLGCANVAWPSSGCVDATSALQAAQSAAALTGGYIYVDAAPPGFGVFKTQLQMFNGEGGIICEGRHYEQGCPWYQIPGYNGDGIIPNTGLTPQTYLDYYKIKDMAFYGDFTYTATTGNCITFGPLRVGERTNLDGVTCNSWPNNGYNVNGGSDPLFWTDTEASGNGYGSGGGFGWNFLNTGGNTFDSVTLNGWSADNNVSGAINVQNPSNYDCLTCGDTFIFRSGKVESRYDNLHYPDGEPIAISLNNTSGTPIIIEGISAITVDPGAPGYAVTTAVRDGAGNLVITTTTAHVPQQVGTEFALSGNSQSVFNLPVVFTVTASTQTTTTAAMTGGALTGTGGNYFFKVTTDALVKITGNTANVKLGGITMAGGIDPFLGPYGWYNIIDDVPNSFINNITAVPNHSTAVGGSWVNALYEYPLFCADQTCQPIVATLTTTSATTDAVSMPYITSSSHCTVSPTNTAALAATLAGVTSKTTNSVTVTHAATSGMTYDLVCTAY